MKTRKNNKSFIFAIILVTITFTLFNIIKIVSRPKVAFIGDNDRRVTRIESPSGFMYYDDKLEMVVARFGVSIINNDNKTHRIIIKTDSSNYKEYNYIKSDFIILKTYIEDEYMEGTDYTPGNEITLEANEKKYLRFYAVAKHSGKGDRTRSGPPIEIEILE